MPDHRLARTRSGYEGYVYQPVRPNPPVMFDCAQVAKTWRDHYEPIPHDEDGYYVFVEDSAQRLTPELVCRLSSEVPHVR